MHVDYNESTPSDIYKLMSQTIVPRPIAWIVTEQNGIVNVAPFSYFTALSSRPPTMIVSVGHKSDGTPKDTLRNLRQTAKCTVCIGTPEDLEALHLSSKELDAQQSESEHFGIPLARFAAAFPPMIKGTPVAFACDFHSEIDLGGSKTVPLILRIRHQFIDDAVVTDKTRLHIDFAPLARVGKGYAGLGEILTPPEIP